MPMFEVGTVLASAEGLRYAGSSLSFDMTTGSEDEGRGVSFVPESFTDALLEATGVRLRDDEGCIRFQIRLARSRAGITGVREVIESKGRVNPADIWQWVLR
jgi:hypothetical protein